MQNRATTNPTRIRSFTRRQGRITPGQQYALDNLWTDYGLNMSKKHNFSNVFDCHAPLFIEIGFGNGESLAEMALANPKHNFIGIEVHKPGVGHLLMRLKEHGIHNVRIFCHDAIEVLEKQIDDNSVAGVFLFFPDPWPKKKHHKRRIVKPEFGSMIALKLLPEGIFHCATDWRNYAENMLSVLSHCNALANCSTQNSFCKRPDYRPMTKFEQRGLKLGHDVWDLIFRKSAGPVPNR